jgi:hypothetical protein
MFFSGLSFGQVEVSCSKTPQHQQKLQEKGELLLNTAVFFHKKKFFVFFLTFSSFRLLFNTFVISRNRKVNTTS